jgi:hypothetical protein
MEITALGRRVTVKINGQLVNDADLNAVADPKTLGDHAGILREKGHVGFLGHHSLVKYRKVEIADLSKPPADNVAPPGFQALFDGKSLAGWKGLVAPDTGKGSGAERGGPPARAAMAPDVLAQQQAAADEKMRAHWRAEEGVLVFDGKGDSLCTARDFSDFELQVDWKIEPKGDSGIYLRGSPQVQIWDDPVGSGGLYNNQLKRSTPFTVADRPVGEWNRFKILMVGEHVTVYLNDVLVVQNTLLENYWERGRPIYPSGQIELQNHGNTLRFKNVFLREIQPAKQ